MSNSHSELRLDITGLRAIAVLAVTLYHIAHVLAPELNLFKGGFLGVDIFFVISGFLMTKIIMTGLDRGNFSLYTFYKRRAKRICPALLAMVIVFLVPATMLLDADTLVKTFRDALRALGFISNVWFARSTGYFDGAATERLFLHTWSLSVEWQFYLLYPLILMLVSRLVPNKNLGFLLFGLTVASLVFGCWYTAYNPVYSYFYLPSRAYELLVGALAYFYPLSFFLNLLKAKKKLDLDTEQREKLSRLVECLGLLCIAVSLVVVDSASGWPNAWSILPLLGTYLCIAADNKRTLLSNVVFQKLGLWSYAIYLVHWPLIVFIGFFSWGGIAWELLVLIFVFGIALHYGIERRRNFGWMFLALYVVAALGVQLVIKNDSKLFIATPKVEFTALSKDNDGNPFHVGDVSRSVDFILTGDSFARQYIDNLENSKVHGIAVIFGGCISSLNYYNQTTNGDLTRTEKCRDLFASFIEQVKQNPGVPIIWAQNWARTEYWRCLNRNGQVEDMDMLDILQHDLPEIANTLAATNNRLYLLEIAWSGDENIKSTFGKNCHTLYYMNNFLSMHLWKHLGCADVVALKEPEANKRLKAIIRELPQNNGKAESVWPVSYIDVAPAFCNEQGCRIMEKETYEPFFYDGSHLSNKAAKISLQYILDQLKLKQKAYHIDD